MAKFIPLPGLNDLAEKAAIAKDLIEAAFPGVPAESPSDSADATTPETASDRTPRTTGNDPGDRQS